MTHDPMCEWAECVCPLDYDPGERGHLVHCPDQYCECDFIAKIRADEKAKWTHVCPDNNCCHQSGDI